MNKRLTIVSLKLIFVVIFVLEKGVGVVLLRRLRTTLI